MCGICGQFNLDGSPADLTAARAMRGQIAHRGPDDEGEWSSGPAAFAFRRLSILDLEGGHQPMSSADGRQTIVFNGEIYNHPEIKKSLEARGTRYLTRSDTESILHLYGLFGSQVFGRLDGMFAVAIWDDARGELILARDPLGVKPLYYAVDGKRLYFCSELRPLLKAGVSAQLDAGALAEYLTYGRVHAPRTALAAVRKLPSGHILRAGKNGVVIEKYWELSPAAAAADSRMDGGGAESKVVELLTAAVRRQLLSDVPLGAFLSGGVDSSLIAALMTKVAGRRVATFTIGFSGAREGLDESAYAKKVARHLGTEHHELILPADVLSRIEDLSPCLDEPVADSAILPTFLLAQFARKKVKVVLTGEGADELFAGYNRYKAAYLSDLIGGMRFLAPVARRFGRGRIFEGLPYSNLSGWLNALSDSAEAEIARICTATDARTLAKSFEAVPLNLASAQALDLRTVLPDSLLMKVDKATMRASLEARVPFLDKALVEYAIGLPAHAKLRWFKGKHLLRKIAAQHLPADIVWRKKHGFLVPWEEWVRGPSPAVDGLLESPDLADTGYFNLAALKRARKALRNGQPEADAGLIFKVAIFALWLRSLTAYK